MIWVNLDGFGSDRSKVNYVDDRNRFAGFSLDQDCCEAASHGVAMGIPSDGGQFSFIENPDLRNYRFVDEDPTVGELEYHDRGGFVAFRIVADCLPDMFVVFENSHNGYYSHKFTYGREGGI